MGQYKKPGIEDLISIVYNHYIDWQLFMFMLV